MPVPARGTKTTHMNYLETNRHSWNQRTEAHLQSAFYDLPGWLAGKSSLRDIERELLPDDLQGQSLLHLQCHFGQDTLSLARLGAQVTGVDLSNKAISAARDLAEKAGLPARFIESDVYALPEKLDETFDIVFTSYGVIGWLPDMDRWAAVVARHLRPGGLFVMAEFHPVVWMLSDDRSRLQYSYFNREAIEETQESSYTDGSAGMALHEITWNHGLAEVIGALLRQGLQLEVFEEYDYSPWNCFSDGVEVAPGQFQLRSLQGIIPVVYGLRAKKV